MLGRGGFMAGMSRRARIWVEASKHRHAMSFSFWNFSIRHWISEG